MGFEIALIIVGALVGVCAAVSLFISVCLAMKYYSFNRKNNSIGMSGVEVARSILDSNGLQHIKVKTTGSLLFGNSYSHFFKKVRIRRLTRHERSITALGIGAQKAALAILDKEGDPDMKKRIRLVPIITFGPFAFIPLIAVGVVLDLFVFAATGIWTLIFGALGFLFYVYAIVLSVMTLKTERRAQDRAYEILRNENMVNEEELSMLKELFHLYNLQYVNDIILSSLELIYTILEIAIAIKSND